MKRRAKLELFSRCRSATISVRLGASHRAPAGSSATAMPATWTSASAMPGRSDLPSGASGRGARLGFNRGFLAHRFADQRCRRVRQYVGARLAEYRLLADFQHDGDGERRDAIKPLMHDSVLHAEEHFAEIGRAHV